jgi:hypothetical protein
VPLSHGLIDATDTSSSVVSARIGTVGFGFEASAFRGRELDGRRWDLEAGSPDSWAVRGSYRRAGWAMQLSTGHLHQPHAWEPFDATRTTASVSFDGPRASILAAWGHNRDRFGALDGYLADAAIRVSARDHVYLRGERVRNDFADAGYHTLNVTEVSLIGTVDAATAGYVRDIGAGFGVGGDINMYRLSYEGPSTPFHGFHVFLRFHSANRPG